MSTILLVDDERPFLDVLTKRLLRRGIDVLAVSGGREALEALQRSQEIDVVVLDVKMPVMDGIDTLKAIKRDYPLMKVVVLTAYPTVKSPEEWVDLGAFECLMKPQDIDGLLDVIDRAREG
ncbi:MAG: response regulator [Desulfomonile sp.]|nr:response regulator [Desulfomonile sp.]